MQLVACNLLWIYGQIFYNVGIQNWKSVKTDK